MFLLFSHKLTQRQIEEAKLRFKIDEFISLPDKLQDIWSNVPPEGELNDDYLSEIKSFILNSVSEKSYAIIEGDYGSTFEMVCWCFKNNIIPLYSTSKRIFNEFIKGDGTVENKHLFKHINFRLYKKM
jgi:hypothetical protein